MKGMTLLAFIFFFLSSNAQHCPWDCSGMILVETAAPVNKIRNLAPVLMDEDHNIIVDTVYGTGLPTFDTCYLKPYADFQVYRVQKTSIHHWYGYDTVYYFAEGLYLLKFNLCKYGNRKLYLQFTNPVSRDLRYEYIEIPLANRISLHELNTEIRNGETELIKNKIRDQVFHISCMNWKLYDADCKTSTSTAN